MAAAGCFFVAQPLKSTHRSSPATARPFSMPSVFALFRPPVDGKFDYLSREEYWSTVMNALAVASPDAYGQPALACPERLPSEPGRWGHYLSPGQPQSFSEWPG